MKQYVVISPPFEITSGGVRVMYGLYGWLLSKGQVAFMNEVPSKGEIIAIYPEIQHGNPANAKTVVRYILNKPGVVPALYSDGTLKQGPTDFGPDDKLYYFSRLYGHTQDNDHYLFLPIINLHLFKDLKNKRTKTCYFIGKGINLNLHNQDSILIDRKFAHDQESLRDLLNECTIMYGYDPVSAMYEVARLCGCRIVLLQNIYSEREWNSYEPGRNGVAFGMAQIKDLQFDSSAFREYYGNMVHLFERKLDRFIDETQNS